MIEKKEIKEKEKKTVAKKTVAKTVVPKTKATIKKAAEKTAVKKAVPVKKKEIKIEEVKLTAPAEAELDLQDMSEGAIPLEQIIAGKTKYFEAVGRRKTSVARVRLFTQGKKDVTVNDKP
jgi:hypothetical protein